MRFLKGSDPFKFFKFALVACCCVLAGCGGESGDLMAIEVSAGSGGREARAIVVTENGLGSCDGSSEEGIPSELLIDAREVERDLSGLAEEGATFPATGQDQREYLFRIKAGRVRFAEGEPGVPDVLPRAQLLAVRLERSLCG